MKRFLPLALGLMACTTARSESTLSRSTHAIQGGTPDTSSNFAVAVIGQGLCSGTLIAPNLVLTARHCVESELDESIGFCENGTLTSASELFVTTIPVIDFEGDPPDPSTLRRVSAILPMPDVAAGCSPDQALVELAEPIGAAAATPVRPAVEPSYLARPSFTPKVTAIGYGLDDAGQSGTRRIREQIDVLCVHDDPAFECAGIPGVTGDFEIIADKGACQGDSGGGLYDQATFTAKDSIVVATVSRGGKDEQGICDPGVYVRVDAFAPFIIDAAIAAAQHGGYPAPSWAKKAVPKPIEPDAGAKKVEATTDDEPEPAPPPTVTTTTTSGCGVAPSTATAPAKPAALGGLVVLGVALGRRRKRRFKPQRA